MIKLTFTSRFLPVLPEGHRFQIGKYSLIREQLLLEGAIQPEQLLDPGPCPEAPILQVHSQQYWQQVKSLQLPPKEVRALGLPLLQETVLRAQNSVHCTLLSALHALQQGIGIHLGGGTHHAFADRPEGFCLLNDLAITAQWLLSSGQCQQLLVLDLDVHQGNGTARIFADNPQVFTFSMHCLQNYPLRKEASDLDVGIAAGTGDEEYLRLLMQHLPQLLESVQPDLVLYQAGVDVLQGDLLGKLHLSRRGCMQRDSYVLENCKQRALPVVVTLGGGYHQSQPVLIDAHCNTVRTALQLYE